MDLKNRKILGYLFQNSRLSASEIGKLVGLSKESVRKRISSLEDNGYIQFFRANVDLQKLGYKKFDIYMRLLGDQNKVLEKIKKISNINWIGTCFGLYDIRISAIAKDLESLTKQLKPLKNDLKELFICQIDSQIKIDYHKLNQELFDLTIKRIPTPELTEAKLDELDNKIINLMLCDARIPFTELASKLEVNPKVIQYRVKKLEQSIIKNYTPDIDGARFGFIWAVILIKTRFIDDTLKKKLLTFATKHKVSTCSFLLGSWDLSINLFAKDIAELSNIMNAFRSAFQEDIIEYNPLIIFNKLPKKYSLCIN